MSRHGSHGVALKLSDMAGTPVFTTVAQITSITPPGFNRGETVVAEHDMTAAVRVINDALYDAGEVVAEVSWDPGHATHDESTGFLEAAVDGATRDWQIVFPDTGATQFDFAAFARYQPGAHDANTGLMTGTLTLRVDGAITVS